MIAFELSELTNVPSTSEVFYNEFLRFESMSMGIYKLAKGAQDPQKPHNEDEVYHVLSGRARIRVGEEHRSVKAGSIIYVKKFVEHAFIDIEEDLVVLVFFAPMETKAQQVEAPK